MVLMNKGLSLSVLTTGMKSVLRLSPILVTTSQEWDGGSSVARHLPPIPLPAPVECQHQMSGAERQEQIIRPPPHGGRECWPDQRQHPCHVARRHYGREASRSPPHRVFYCAGLGE